jgi:hypothetical protein
MDFSQKNLKKGNVRNDKGDCKLGKVTQFDFS